MNRLLLATLVVSLAAHASVFAPMARLFDQSSPAAVYDDGEGTDSFKMEQGIALEGIVQGEAAERIEVAEVAPMVAQETPPPVAKPIEPELDTVLTATESPVEAQKAAEQPPPPDLQPPEVKPVEVAAVEQAAQVEMFAEKSAGKAQDGSRTQARLQYAGQLNKAIRKVRIGAFKNFGTVTVQFEIDRTGKLLTRKILASSGNDVLDQKAIDWIDKAEFPPLPDALNTREVFTIPLIFQRANG